MKSKYQIRKASTSNIVKLEVQKLKKVHVKQKSFREKFMEIM